MKKIFPFLLVLFFFTDCKKDPEILFEMAYERDFVIPAGLNTFQTHTIYLQNISIGSYLSNNNVDPADLAAINPGAARISTIFSGISDYSFIRNVSIKIFTTDENNAREVFWRPTVPLNTGEDLDIIPTLIDAKQFFENNRFTLAVKFELQAVPQQTVESKLRFSFLAK